MKAYNLLENIMHAILSGLFRLFRKELKEEQFSSFMQFVKFGIVGLSNTLISYVVYLLFLLLFKKLELPGTVDYMLAYGLGFLISVVWSYYWNNKYVFSLEQGEKRSGLGTFIKTLISYSFTGLFLNSILLYLWVDIVGISEIVAPVINLLISVPLNFIINKLWAFKKKSD